MLDLKDYAKQQKAIEHCRKQVNESRKLLMETGVERFAGSVHEVPAVGEYSFDSSWDKKTFNIRYKGGHTKTK